MKKFLKSYWTVDVEKFQKYVIMLVYIGTIIRNSENINMFKNVDIKGFEPVGGGAPQW